MEYHTVHMINKYEIIKKIAEERFIENSLSKICFSPYKDDLAQDLYVDLLNSIVATEFKFN